MQVAIDVEAIVKQLPLRDKIRLMRYLERETWAKQLDEAVGRIRTRPAVQRLSFREINRVVAEVRKIRYARASRRS